MADLFNSPVLLIEQPSSQLNYQITDPQGAPLAHVTQVAGNLPKSGFAQFFSDAPDRSRAVVRVDRPDGTPLFFVDRADGGPVSVQQPPCAVVAPDGQLIGRVEHNTAEFAQSLLQGGALGRRGGTFHQAHQLLDAQQQPLCRITWEDVERRPLPSGFEQSSRSAGGRFAVYTDMNGTQVARMDTLDSDGAADRFSLQLNFQLPEPMRTLVIASPLALDLMPGS